MTGFTKTDLLELRAFVERNKEEKFIAIEHSVVTTILATMEKLWASEEYKDIMCECAGGYGKKLVALEGEVDHKYTNFRGVKDHYT